jgi:hypothetical protein
MSGDLLPSPFAARPSGRWPGRPLLISRLRDVLRREFQATDAWVVQTTGRCRLEARVAFRVVVLLDGQEETFWAPFYTAAVRHRFSGGYMIGELAPTQRPRHELILVLRPMWERAVGRSASN